MISLNRTYFKWFWLPALHLQTYGYLCVCRMKPKKVKEDDAPRTIACPHKVSALVCHFFPMMCQILFPNLNAFIIWF